MSGQGFRAHRLPVAGKACSKQLIWHELCQGCQPDTFRLVSTQNLSDAARDVSGMQPSCTRLSAGLADRHPCSKSHGVIAAVLLIVSIVLGSKANLQLM